MLTTVLLAFVQSMTEFLPISSSGHLFLVAACGISHHGLAMDVALHIGTLLAVIIYFYHDILQMLCFKNIRLALLLAWATVPIVIVGLCFAPFIEHIIRAPVLVAICSITFGILLWIVDKKNKGVKTIQSMNFKDAFLIGCSQILALVPGVSRSGITMTMGRYLKIKREDCAHFSMLLSIPTILGAMGYVLYKNMTGDLKLPSPMELQLAVWAAAGFGLLGIAFLMKWLKCASFFIFAVYRVILGILVLCYFL
ncbi:MAG: undecaprenyl-diphosphate phosphatase [Alphaproteobacteria bacterium]|nr:undecaprenyl-diphosphate phosphatase [Alphaproteobacteria bacterium]